MKRYTLSHLSDEFLLRSLIALVAQDRATTAELLAHIAEVDERKLHLPAGYSTMHQYCVGALRLSDDEAFKRITAARAGRRFPAILDAVAAGKLHLTAVGLLAPHLTEETVAGLIEAAAGKTKAGIERLLAERFPKTDMLAWVVEAPTSSSHTSSSLAPERVDLPQVVAKPAPPLAPERVAVRPRVTPLSAKSFSLQVTVSADAHENLRYAQALVGHQAGSGDIAWVIEEAIAVYAAHLEKQKFGATLRPRRNSGKSSANPRHIPARVKRAVWERDCGRCTFVSESGHRCEARKRLEFDHVLEVARGGEATVEGIRLLCRAHNQYAAERTFGTEFMRHKRIAAAEARMDAREVAEARAGAS